MPNETTTIDLEWSPPLSKLADLWQEAAEVLLDVPRVAEDYIFPQLRSHIEKVYATQGEAAGQSWADYSDEPAYAAYKAAVLGFDGPDDLPVGDNRPGGLLRWKGQERLFPSLTNRAHPEHIERTRTMEAEYGTEVPYARRLFQTGGSGPFGEQYPPRPVFQFSPEQEALFNTGLDRQYREYLRDIGIDVE